MGICWCACCCHCQSTQYRYTAAPSESPNSKHPRTTSKHHDLAKIRTMGTGWAHMGTSIVASFLASLVECVEALTVVLAVGSVRGWRSALTGSATAIAVLLVIVAVIGTALTRIPLPAVQLAIGTLLLLFGLRWLRKAILRSAGQIPLHDEQAAFAKNTEAMRRGPTGTWKDGHRWDKVAF